MVKYDKNLRKLLFFLFQGRIIARDGGSPSRSATAIIKININRNLHVPTFNPSSYSQKIYETELIGNVVVDVNAEDNDRVVSAVAMEIDVCFLICLFSHI